MKRGRHVSQCAALHPDIRVTFETDETDLMPCQHARIGGAMRLMAAVASFEAHGRMHEREWTSFVAVALHAARLVCRKGPHLPRIDRPVGIMAIYARHSSFG